jgi:CRISPR-associated protein Csd2
MSEVNTIITGTSNETAVPFLDRFDIVVLIEAAMTNPNGDPDAGNLPRQDPVTGEGIITNVCIKRKLRDYLAEVRGVALYHANGVVLRDQRAEALRSREIEPSGDDEAIVEEADEDPKKSKGRRKTGRAAVSGEDLRRNQKIICEQFFDARTFGAVMDTGAARAANARGPVAVSHALSIDPVRIIEHTITRQSVETPDERKKERMFGSQPVVRYGLYRFDLTVHPFHAQRTGFGTADMALLKEALINAFEFDQSANRRLTMRGIYAFRHSSADGKPSLGHQPRASLLERIVVRKVEGVSEPLSFADYTVTTSPDDLSPGVTFERWG